MCTVSIIVVPPYHLVSHMPLRLTRRQSRIAYLLAAVSCAALYAGCSNSQPGSGAERNTHNAPSLALSRVRAAYASAVNDDRARRDVCISAIDEGLLAPGAPVEHVRVICGSDFYEPWPEADGVAVTNVASFLPPIVGTANDRHFPGAPKFSGWYMFVHYVHGDGRIEWVRLSNVHKGMSAEVLQQSVSVFEVARLYDSARTVVERRRVCLLAIDSGYISTRAPYSNVGAIFGDDVVEQGRNEQGRQRADVTFLRTRERTIAPNELRLVVIHGEDYVADYYLETYVGP